MTRLPPVRPTRPAAALISTPIVKFPPRENVDGSIVVEDHHEISYLGTSLEAPASTPVAINDGPDQPRGRASDHDALSAFSAENNPALTTLNDGEPFCLPEHISWNCFSGIR